jgi:hypothetical protein
VEGCDLSDLGDEILATYARSLIVLGKIVQVATGFSANGIDTSACSTMFKTAVDDGLTNCRPIRGESFTDSLMWESAPENISKIIERAKKIVEALERVLLQQKGQPPSHETD